MHRRVLPRGLRATDPDIPLAPDGSLALQLAGLLLAPVAVLVEGPPGSGRRWVASTLARRCADGGVARVSADMFVTLPSVLAAQRLDAALVVARRRNTVLDDLGHWPYWAQARVARTLDGVRRPRIVAVADGDVQPALRDAMLWLEVTPLRERQDDVGCLLRWALVEHARHAHGAREPDDVDAALTLLRSLAWPREIGDIDRLARCAVASGSVVAAAEPVARDRIGSPVSGWAEPQRERAARDLVAGQAVALKDVRRSAVREAERLWLGKALETTAGNDARAARLLGISRRTLNVKARDLGLLPTVP